MTAAASAALNGFGYPPGPPLGPTIALYLLALSPERTRVPRWATGGVVIGLLVVHAGAVGLAEDAFPTVPLLFGPSSGAAPGSSETASASGATVSSELEERARRAERDAERERRLAAAEERTRIARDLHDSAGHAINVILVQAGAARLLSRQDPERSQAALETIEEVARETLGEIDQLVRALRDDDLGDEAGGRWSRRPASPLWRRSPSATGPPVSPSTSERSDRDARSHPASTRRLIASSRKR